jgi:hypothetical protein
MVIVASEFARSPAIRRERSAAVWLFAAFVAVGVPTATSAAGVRAAQQVPASQPPTAKAPVPPAPVAPQAPAIEQAPDGDTLACELSAAKRDIELLQRLGQENERSEQLQRDVESMRRDLDAQKGLVAKAREEATKAKQAADGADAELKRAVQKERERAEALTRDLAQARSESYAHQAQSGKAADEAAELRKQIAAGVTTTAVREPTADERERIERLERDLATARRDTATLVAQAAKATEEAARKKETSEREMATSRSTLEAEKSKAERLERELATARRDLAALSAQASKATEVSAQATQTAQAAKAAEEATRRKEVAEREVTASRSALQEEKSKVERLERELTTARRDTAALVAQTTKATEEAARKKEAAERETATSRTALQEEKSKAERLERELALAWAKPMVAAKDPAVRQAVDAGPDGVEPPRKPAPARVDVRPSAADVAGAVRLLARATVLLGQGDIVSARTMLERAAEMGSVEASFALAETYDPSILAKWGTYGTRGDPDRARELYARANAGGIGEAKARFEALTR